MVLIPRTILICASLMVLVGVQMRASDLLTRIGEIRQLPPEIAAKACPVHVRGVVTWRGSPNELMIQDESAGIWVNLGAARERRLWLGGNEVVEQIREGMELEIEGFSDQGGYAPVILPERIRILGVKPLPVAQPIDRVRFFSGAEAGGRVEVRGVVLGYEPLPGGWAMRLDTVLGVLTVEASLAAVPDPVVIVDAEVRVRGVAASGFNGRSELINLRVLISVPGDILIERPAAASPFEAPLVRLDRLLTFHPEPTTPHRVRIQGNVTFALPGQYCYLQEGLRSVRVETRSNLALKLGDRAEAVGFVDTARHLARLGDAAVRRIGQGQAPAAVAIKPEEIMALNITALNAGQAARPHDFDGHLIRFRARLLAVQSAPNTKLPWRKLTLEQGSMIIGAILPMGEVQIIDNLRLDSEVEVTGIVQLEYAPITGARQSLRPVRLDVLLRSAADVEVRRMPSWWTAKRLVGMMAVGVLTLGGLLLWAGQLRRQVRLKTKELAIEMRARRDAAIEFQATLRERNRLAANLHDTLLQTMSGINYQLEACESEALPSAERPSNHLQTARRMVQRGQEDLRGTVWALRVLPLNKKTLTDALRTLAQQIGEGHAVKISVQGQALASPLTEFVAGNLLLITQEALHNALKHAHATRLTVNFSVHAAGQRALLVIHDDGVGFDLNQANSRADHFGLQGMRERAERLGGTLQIDSILAGGSTVRIDVPLRAFDDDIA